ncbi:hypothetical protein BZA70DRAFT_238003 [Myxozyma melibiosi]|uniref:Myb-like domain-containing protein n=1 Tax=Myxozyma melibiosi TaxID=54550 RepID=A0ABR1F6W1_9ASCO
MAELCRDIHIGRKTDNYDKLKQIKQEAKDQKRRALYENPEDREKRIKLENEQEAERRKRAAELVDKGLGNNSAAGRANGVAALRVVNGKIEVDQDSLLVDRHAIADAERTTEEREVDSDLKRVVNSASWSRRERVERWSAAETVKFYNSLSMWGTDFGLIVQMFPGRSRRQIKNKFNAEERKNPARIHTALTSRIPVGKDYVDNAMKSESKEAENAASAEDTERAGSEQPPSTDPATAPPADPSSVSEPVVIAD